MGGAGVSETNPVWLWPSEKSESRVGSTKSHTRKTVKGPGRPGGNIQGGFLEEGASKLVSRTDRFNTEGGREAFQAEESAPPPSAPPNPTPKGAEPPRLDRWPLSPLLWCLQTLQWGHPLSQDTGACHRGGRPACWQHAGWAEPLSPCGTPFSPFGVTSQQAFLEAAEV